MEELTINGMYASLRHIIKQYHIYGIETIIHDTVYAIYELNEPWANEDALHSMVASAFMRAEANKVTDKEDFDD